MRIVSAGAVITAMSTTMKCTGRPLSIDTGKKIQELLRASKKIAKISNSELEDIAKYYKRKLETLKEAI